jgi:hypothetical protein
MGRRMTAYACVREGREGMLAYLNLDAETAHPYGRRVWVITADPDELGVLPLEYSDAEVDAFMAGYALALQRAREHGAKADPPPSGPIGRPYRGGGG